MNKNGRGMNLVISLLLIVLLVFWFSGILRSMEDTCTQAEFNQMLDAGEISGAVVVQNREVPTGSVEVHLTSGDEKVLVVSDVNPVLEELERPEIAEIADIEVMNDASSDSTNWVVKAHGHTLVSHVLSLC